MNHLNDTGLARLWHRMDKTFVRHATIDRWLDELGCTVTVWVDGDGQNPVRMLSSAGYFNFDTVSRMWVDGVEVAPARTIVFGDTAEHAVRIQFEFADQVPANAFRGCAAITAVTLEPSVAELSSGLFHGCINMARVTVEAPTLPIAPADAFGDPSDSSTMCCSAWGTDVARVYLARTAFNPVSPGWSALKSHATFKPILVEHPFSIAAGRTVCFASANLQYLAAKNVFTFGKWQGEILGASDNHGNREYPQQRSASAKLIDLYSWGCSGGGFNGYHRHWKPYDCLYYSSASSYAYYYGIVYGSQNYSYNLDGTGADWGIANRFPGEPVRTGWRTLNANEWQYLFQNRTNAAALRAKGSVSGTKGLFLLPDDWTLPDGIALTTDAATTTNYSSNTLTYEEWDAMEDAGAVFLPATGYRSAVSANSATVTADDYTGTGRPSVGDADHSGNPTGSYWSTSYSGSQAFRFYFANGSNAPKNATDRYKGYGVRLVRNIS